VRSQPVQRQRSNVDTCRASSLQEDQYPFALLWWQLQRDPILLPFPVAVREPFLFVADATDTQLEHPPSPSLEPRRSVIFPAGSPFRQPVFNLDTRRFGQIDELQPHSIFARGPSGPTDPPFRFEVLPQRARYKTICGQLNQKLEDNGER